MRTIRICPQDQTEPQKGNAKDHRQDQEQPQEGVPETSEQAQEQPQEENAGHHQQDQEEPFKKGFLRQISREDIQRWGDPRQITSPHHQGVK